MGHGMERRKVVAGSVAMAAIARLGLDGIEATVRTKGQIEPTKASDDLPLLVEHLTKHDLERVIMATDITRADAAGTEKLLRLAASHEIVQTSSDELPVTDVQSRWCTSQGRSGADCAPGKGSAPAGVLVRYSTAQRPPVASQDTPEAGRRRSGIDQPPSSRCRSAFGRPSLQTPPRKPNPLALVGKRDRDPVHDFNTPPKE
jgi:hypothetical protein